MKDFTKEKLPTLAIITFTVILAGIAIFTAFRLYQLRQESVAPTAPEDSFAWDCSKYNFSVSSSGVVKVQNDSSRNEPSQRAQVRINGSQVAEFDVPALAPGQGADLGTVSVPNEPFSWQVVGTRDCQDSGQATPVVSCQSLTFNIEIPESSPTPSPTGTVVPTQTPTPTGTTTPVPTNTSAPTATPTDQPRGGEDPTPTPTSTPTTGTIAQATPTSSLIAQSTPIQQELPQAGATLPTYILISSAALLLLLTFLLAI